MHEFKFIFEFSEKDLRRECLEKMDENEKNIKRRKASIFLSIPIIIGLFLLTVCFLNQSEKPIFILFAALLMLGIIIIISEDFMYFEWKKIHKTNEILLQKKEWYSLAGNLHLIDIFSYFGKDKAIAKIQENVKKNKNEYEAEIEIENFNKFLKIKLEDKYKYFFLKNDYPVNFEDFPIVLFSKNGVYLEKEKTV